MAILRKIRTALQGARTFDGSPYWDCLAVSETERAAIEDALAR